MKNFPIIIEKKCLLILAIIVLLCCNVCHAAIPIHRIPVATTNRPDSLATTRAEKILSTLKSNTADHLSVLQKMKMVGKMKKAVRNSSRNDDNQNGKTSCIWALAAIVTMVVGVALWSTPLIVLTLLLLSLSLTGAIGALYYGIVGLSEDKSPLFATAGLIAAIAVLAIAVIVPLIWLINIIQSF